MQPEWDAKACSAQQSPVSTRKGERRRARVYSACGAALASGVSMGFDALCDAREPSPAAAMATAAAAAARRVVASGVAETVMQAAVSAAAAMAVAETVMEAAARPAVMMVAATATAHPAQ